MHRAGSGKVVSEGAGLLFSWLLFSQAVLSRDKVSPNSQPRLLDKTDPDLSAGRKHKLKYGKERKGDHYYLNHDKTTVVPDTFLSQGKTHGDEEICYADMRVGFVKAGQRDGHWSDRGQFLQEQYSKKQTFR